MLQQITGVVGVVPDLAEPHCFAAVGAGVGGMWCRDANVESRREGWLNCACKDVSRAKARRSVKKPEYFTLSSGVGNAGDGEKFIAHRVVPASAFAGRTAKGMCPIDVKESIANPALDWLAGEAGPKSQSDCGGVAF